MNIIGKYLIFSLCCFFSFSLVYSQKNRMDSLLSCLPRAAEDTDKLNLLVDISEVCDLNDIGKYAKQAVVLADKLLAGVTNERVTNRIKSSKATALNNLGFMSTNTGNIVAAAEYYKQSLELYNELKDEAGIAMSFNNIGGIYQNEGDISRALEYYSKSLIIREKLHDEVGLAYTVNNIGDIYQRQGDGEGALKYFNRSLKIREKIGDKEGIATSLNNIGGIYDSRGELEIALKYYTRSLDLYEQIGNKQGVAYLLNNTGNICEKQRKSAMALDYFKRSLAIEKQISDTPGTAYSYDNIGTVYFKQKKFLLALAYEDSSLVVSKAIGFPENIRNAELTITAIHSAMGNYKESYFHYKQYIIYRDSLNNNETRKASIKNQLKYEYDKKEAVIKEQQDKERALSEEKNNRQQIVIWSVAAGLLLVVGFAGFVSRSLKTTRHQKLVIEQKQKDILDSIHYAKRIQRSLLPQERSIDRALRRLQK
jgi:tetratricopeptide (TPR) repeat protein